MSRPYRFGVNLTVPAPAEGWSAKCRRAEELGYDVIQVPDHLGMVAPFPALVAAARDTDRPRLGTFVLNAAFRNPALLAREVATTDALTGGRLELGPGTGYVPAEHDTAGLPFGSPGERVDHLRRTVEELERLLGDEEHLPRPAQRSGVPLLIGGNGDRMLEPAARRADIAAFTRAGVRCGAVRPAAGPGHRRRARRARRPVSGLRGGPRGTGRAEPADPGGRRDQGPRGSRTAVPRVPAGPDHGPGAGAARAPGGHRRGDHRAGAGAARAVRVHVPVGAGAVHGGLRPGDAGAARRLTLPGLRQRRDTGRPGRPHAGIRTSARAVRGGIAP
ncbi:TIGR03621 family F420-dependent LLM class oxidoreductase [Streptomyces sp. M92]|uniref:TIGR03621 family F420-dependent LLM class oxidoreductase n=1 Tax=Streptomyces sp. M92 TaxID=2944250 RepID=UPI00234A6CC3|nr:TIGR03621 family F420-dependent LLM class oxidoreductase [Streptomyces sp. M92]WCN06141.1 TIGR03621 family F420-dependent LLM class oxidoreductase [Streptomyces sp. M92]